MTPDKFITVGLAGEQRHGKTALVRCLAGTNGDLSGDAGVSHEGQPVFMPLSLSSGTCVGMIDLPGGEIEPWKQAMSGLNVLDLAILVVAADEGVTPRTKHYLEFFHTLKVEGGFVALTKTELVDQETIEIAQMELVDILEGSCLEGKPVIPFSGAEGRGLDHVLDALRQEAEGMDGRRYFATAHYKSLKRQLLETATRILEHDVFKMAVSEEEIRSRPETNLDEPLVGRVLAELRKEGKLVRTDGGYRLPSLSRRLPPKRKELADQMLEYAQGLGYASFSARTFCELHWKTFEMDDIHKLLGHLRSRNKLVRLNDGRYMTSEGMEEIKEKVRDAILKNGSLTVQDSLDELKETGQLDRLLASGARFSDSVMVIDAHARGELPSVGTRRIGAALIFERLWKESGIKTVIRGLLAQRKFEFPVERVIFLAVLHRLFGGGPERLCDKWADGTWYASMRFSQRKMPRIEMPSLPA
jgi:hypothetical protein